MGTAREELVALIKEALFSTRKTFGMFGQIQIVVRDVTPSELGVGIWTRHRLDTAWVVTNVRNAVLNFLQDLVPVERFVAEYDNPTFGIEREIHDLPYLTEGRAAGGLRSSVILVEPVAGPAREALRPRFAEAWQRFLDEEAR